MMKLRTLVAVGSLAVLLTACSPDYGGASPDPSSAAQPSSSILAVPEAMTAELPVAEVRGYILVDQQKVVRFCTGLSGSFPPQCGQPALTVIGLLSSRIPDPQSDQGIVWTGETTLHGSLSGGVLTVG
jgi:hypothetical protein